MQKLRREGRRLSQMVPCLRGKIASPVMSSRSDRVLRKEGVARTQYYLTIFLDVVFIVAFRIAAGMFFELKSDMSVSRSTFYREQERLFFYGCCAVGALLLTIMRILRTFTLRKMTLCICERTVYGSGGKTLIPFDIQRFTQKREQRREK